MKIKMNMKIVGVMLPDILETQLPFQKTISAFNSPALAMHKNWNGPILGVVLSIYQNTVCNLTLQIWFQYQPSYHISGSIEGTTLKITKFMPLIMAIVVPSSTLVG